MDLYPQTASSRTELASWDAFRGGDVEALGQLYRTYFWRLFTYGKRISTSEELAQDCIQDLFVKLWEKRERLPAVVNCQGYLFKSYRTLLIDRLREKGKIRQDSSFDNIEPTLPIQETIVTEETTEENRRRLLTGIASLPERQREIIYLRFYQGLSYEEISSTLEINNQSVRNSVSGSLKLLRKLFPIALLTLLKMIA